MNGLQIGRAADDLSLAAARLLEQHVERPADAAGIEGRLLAVDELLQLREPLVHRRGVDHSLHIRGRCSRTRRIFE